MTSEEQQQLNTLRSQLDFANRTTEEIRSQLTSALGESDREGRLYRNLFWGLLLLVALGAIFNLLAR